MLTAEGCRHRRHRLWAQFAELPDWILIGDPAHLVYFANYHQSPFEFRSNEAGAVLILGRDDSAILVADNLLQPYADTAHVTEVIAPTWYRGVESAPARPGFLVRNVLDRLARCPGAHFGIETARVPVGIIEGLREARGPVRLTAVDGVIPGLRRRKEPDELALLRRSVRAGEAGFAAARRDLRPGMTELEAYFLVQRAAQEADGAAAVVYGDFVSGPRCEAVGGPPGHRKIAAGDLVILDFSTVIHHYRADLATTFACGGPPTARQRELFQACLEALAAGEKVLRAGAAARVVDQAVRSAFAARDLAQNFPGHSGHGVGLGHPEAPFLVPESADTLKEGDVVTLEPGQYVAGVGGLRYEHNYLITATGYERLSGHALRIET
jgi:Xaa-Pro aminopeptidase